MPFTLQVAGNHVNEVGTTGVTVTHGFSLANDDVLYAFVGQSDDTGTSGPSFASSSGGTWTELIANQQAAGNDRGGAILRRVVTNAGGEPSSYTFTKVANAQSDGLAAIVVRVRGADVSGTPEDASAVTADVTNDFTPDNVTITTATNGALVLIGHVACGGAGTSYDPEVTPGAPSTWTLLSSQIEDVGDRPILLEVASKEIASSGLVTPGAWTCTGGGAGDEGLTFAVAVKPGAVTVTAAAAAGLQFLGASAQGAFEASGDAAAALQPTEALAAGALSFEGSASAAVQHLGASATGELVFIGSSAATLQILAAAAVGAAEVQGAAAAALQNLIALASGELIFIGSAAAAVQILTATAAGRAEAQGLAVAELQVLIASASGSFGAGVAGAATAAIQPLAAAALGELIFTGSSAATLEILSALASGEQTHHGAASAGLQVLEGLASGELIYLGNAAGTLQFLQADGSGLIEVTGTAAVALQALIASAQGLLPGAPPVILRSTGMMVDIGRFMG